jgi:apoptosis-inducing factor 3
VEQGDGKIFAREKRAQPIAQRRAKPGAPNKIVIVGGGGAGFAAAEMLRRRNYQGEIIMLSSDDAPPVDRPNLSKDYLAGNAPEDWVPLRSGDFYSDNAIDLRLRATVTVVSPTRPRRRRFRGRAGEGYSRSSGRLSSWGGFAALSTRRRR